VKFTEELDVKKKVFEVMPTLIDLYPGGVENPELACFYIEKGEAKVYAFGRHDAEKEYSL
jgi:uncharacterized pyridoxamine 5'-phosphate oxidase family protein